MMCKRGLRIGASECSRPPPTKGEYGVGLKSLSYGSRRFGIGCLVSGSSKRIVIGKFDDKPEEFAS